MIRYEPRNADGEWIVYDKPELGRAGGWHVSHTPPDEGGALREAIDELREIHARSGWADVADPLLELWRIRYGDREEWPQWLLDMYPEEDRQHDLFA